MRRFHFSFLFAALFMVLAGGLNQTSPHVSAQASTATGAQGCVQAFWGSGSVTGGGSITLKVKFKEASDNLNMYVALTSSDPAAVPVPETMLVPAGEISAIISVKTNPVGATEQVTITASTGTGCEDTHIVTIKAPVLRSLAVQSVMRSGGLGKITVCLTGRAAVDVPIQMTSSVPGVLAAATIIVPAGKGCTSYNSPVGVVTEPTPVTVTAHHGAVQLDAQTVVKVIAPSV